MDARSGRQERSPGAIAAWEATRISEKIIVGKYIVCTVHSMLDFLDVGTLLSVCRVSLVNTLSSDINEGK